ncbi:MAG TPA: beta-ketoacyl synthase N-terminal-like domain-containing protein, partial [Thermoanaerobaculia bacterium]|nr:beta-ketoacyl synthase N-terminal-like domain-containing protein [Thermoanaerobaculia bacterium]
LSGDWVPVGLPDRLRRSFAGARLVALGGATEATVWSNWFPVDEVDPAWSSIPYGRPIANARYHVLDRRLGPCPVAVPGDLYIGGECLSSGYSAEPRQTAGSYLPDPFGCRERPGAVLYRTGDRARHFPDGILEFLGRLDTQVKVRGFRIELGEIEAVLAGHPGVAEAVVLARGNGRGAGGDRRLVAYYIPGDPPATEEELLRLARETLPDYMVPQAFVPRESWPLAATGKLDRSALPAPEEVRAPREAEGALEPPRNGLEGVVAAVWREVLETDRVGREESFFDLGGHSLLLARVQARLQEELEVPVGMVDLFRHPTVRSLAAHLEEAGAGAAVEEAPAPRPAPRPVRAPAPAADRRIAVVGLAGRFPGAKSVERFWENLRSGVESIRHFTDEELLEAGFPPELLAEPNLVRAHGVLDDPDLFDAAFFGYSPREAQVIDPQQRLFLEVAWEALEDAGYLGPGQRRAVGVFAGVSDNSYLREIHRHPDLVRALGPHQIAFSNHPDYVASLVSYRLGLEGPAV